MKIRVDLTQNQWEAVLLALTNQMVECDRLVNITKDNSWKVPLAEAREVYAVVKESTYEA